MREYLKSWLYVKTIVVSILLTVYFYNVDTVSMVSSILLGITGMYAIIINNKEIEDV